MTSISKWTGLTDIPHDGEWNIGIFNLNPNEFGIVWNSSASYFNSRKFNTHTNKFTDFVTNSDMTSASYGIAFHPTKQILYVFQHDGKIHSIDTLTNKNEKKRNANYKFETKFKTAGQKYIHDFLLNLFIDGVKEPWLGTYYNAFIEEGWDTRKILRNINLNILKEMGVKDDHAHTIMKAIEDEILHEKISGRGSRLFIGNNIHIIKDNNHFIGQIENNSLQTIGDFNWSHSRYAITTKAVYIPSKRLILLLEKHYNSLTDVISSELWKYSLVSSKWTNVKNISFPGFTQGIVVTSDERYVVFVAGESSRSGRNNSMFVLDLKDDTNWKLRQSKIKCPFGGECFAIRTGGVDSTDKILASGFVRKCFSTKIFKDIALPPVNIIKLIAKWYNCEMIHAVQDWGNSHYGIYLKDILASLSN